MTKSKIQPSESLRKAITKARTDLKEISLNTYIVSLRSLYKRLHPTSDLSEPLTSEFLKEKEKIMKDLDDKKITTKKNILTAILVALSSDEKKDDKLNDFYQIKLKDLNKNYNEFLDKQEKTDTQRVNWIDYDTFLTVINDLLDKVKKEGIPTKEKLSRSEYNLLQKYVILSFYQVFPLRNDIADMKVLTQKEYDDLEKETRDKHNYFITDKKGYKMQLNQFKTVKRIGPKTYEIPEKLSKIVKLWLKHNTSGWLFTISNMRDAVNPNGVTKLLNSIFSKACDGKKISSSMLRHISISEKLKDEPTIAETKEKEEKTVDKYLHSSGMNQLYRKVK